MGELRYYFLPNFLPEHLPPWRQMFRFTSRPLHPGKSFWFSFSGGLGGHRNRLNILNKSKIFCTCQESSSDSSGRETVVESLYRESLPSSSHNVIAWNLTKFLNTPPSATKYNLTKLPKWSLLFLWLRSNYMLLFQWPCRQVQGGVHHDSCFQFWSDGPYMPGFILLTDAFS